MKANVLLIILLGMLACCCTSIPKHASVIDVPFIQQEQTNFCGVTSLAMAFEYYNITYNFTNLVEEAFIPILKGSPLKLLADTANKYGLNVEADSIGVDGLKDAILENQIPIIYLAPLNSSDIGHFSIITGISSNGRKLRIHETDSPNHWVRSSIINKRGVSGIFPALIISKPNK